MLRFLQRIKRRRLLRNNYFLFAVVIISLVFIACIYTGWMIHKTNLNHWKSKTEKASNRAGQLFQEKLQETSNIMFYMGRQILKDGAYDLKKIAANICSIATNIRSDDWMSGMPDRMFTWSIFDWVDQSDQMRVTSRLGIVTEPRSVRHREYARTCREKPWTLQVCRPTIGLFSGVWIIPVGVGIQNSQGVHLGILTGGLQIEYLTHMLQNAIGTDEIDFLVLDTDLNVIFHSFQEKIETKDILYQNTRLLKGQFNQNSAIQDPPVQVFDINFYNYKLLKGFPYIILTGCRKEILQREFINSCLPLFIEIFAMGIFSLLILYAFWKRVSKPVQYFSHVAKQISQGELEIQISKPYPIEMRQLAMYLKQIATYIKHTLSAQKQLQLSYQQLNQRHQELE